MKKKEMKFETMLSTVWCWDCNKPLKKGMKTDNDCDCKKTMSKKKVEEECCECNGDGQIIVRPAVSAPHLEECTWCDGKGVA